MITRAGRAFIVSGLVLAFAQGAFGAAIFGGSISMDDTDLADLNNVAQGAQITLDVAASVTYTSNPGDDVNWIQLNFANSSSALSLSGATWAWSSDTNGISGITNEYSMSDYIVGRQGTSGITATSFNIGILTFNAPTTNGTYTVDLTGGSIAAIPVPTNTFMADGLTLMYNGNSNNPLTLGSFTFTVVPEPGTLILLGCGGLGILLRRRKA